MPIDRSPPREVKTCGDNTQQDPASPVTLDDDTRHTRTGTFGEHAADTSRYPYARRHSDDPESQTYAIRAIKTCTFWRDHAKTWFTQLEAKFRAHNIRSDDLKFCLVIDNLDKESMLEIADIIESPPATDRYQKLKETLIFRLTDSDEKRWRKLLNDVELGDRKPTHLLREMQRLTRNAVDEQLLQTLWLQRMPQRIQELLSVAEGVALDKLAELADKAMERTHLAIASADAAASDTPTTQAQSTILSAIENLTQQVQRLTTTQGEGRRARSKSCARNRPRSTSRNKYQKSKYCFYHSKFGKDARNCVQPCVWTKALAIKAPEDSGN